MTYRSDFYKMQHIIGYTGDINRYPTVYFQQGHQYGHITQAHNSPLNVGREEVCSHRGYHIDNYFIEGKWRSIEWEGPKVVHVSRNPFIRRQFFDHDDLLTLGVALFRFSDIKPVYQRGVEEQEEIKTMMLDEMKSLFDVARNPRFARNVNSEPQAARVIDGSHNRTWA